MFLINIFGLNSVLVLLITFIVCVYFYSTRIFNFWKSRGIDGPRPILLFGTFYQLLLRSAQESNWENTRKYGKFVGGFFGHTPILGIADPKIIKDICIKDFNIFVNRNQILTGDPINDKLLFNLAGDEWKRMRSIISPSFSSGKMRKMHPIMVDCVKRLENALDKIALDERNEFELKELLGKFSMDVIGTCAFGTRIDVYNKERADPLIENVNNMMKPSFAIMVAFILMITFPRFWKFIFSKVDSPLKIFRTTFIAIKEMRESEDREYNDFFQLMLNAINNTNDCEEQDLELDDSDQIFGQTNTQFKNIKRGIVTEDDLLANCFQFLLAGYETTASFLSFFIYSLALNEKCQQKLYEEIKQFNGEFDYQSFTKMPYLEACFAETLRLYPTLPTLIREASEDYVLGDTAIILPKGTLVGLDVHTIHHSPEYYPEPDKWDPDRFMPENQNKLIANTFLPFGIGPRNCVGMRFALLESKTAITHLVHRYEFIKTPNTKPLTKPLKYAFNLNYGDLKIGLKLRNI